ncbi:MAG: hypothetical protein ABL908_14450 [Hyphomicrobium sp.]
MQRDGARGEAERAAKFNPYHDELGRFTTGDGGGGGDGAIQPAAFRPRFGGGKPPPPPPPAKPAQPQAPGAQPGAGGPAQPKPPKPSEQRLDEILKPGGNEIGEKVGGAGTDARTVSKEELEALRGRLLDGAKEITPKSDYAGKWFQRPDGTIVGVRLSEKFGTTLDVVEGGKSGLKNGYRIHGK